MAVPYAILTNWHDALVHYILDENRENRAHPVLATLAGEMNGEILRDMLRQSAKDHENRVYVGEPLDNELSAQRIKPDEIAKQLAKQQKIETTLPKHVQDALDKHERKQREKLATQNEKKSD